MAWHYTLCKQFLNIKNIMAFAHVLIVLFNILQLWFRKLYLFSLSNIYEKKHQIKKK